MHQIRQNARPMIRERRESPDQRERGTIAPRRADERRDRRSSGAIDERARPMSAPLVDRRARSSDAHRSSINERRDRPTRDERACRSRSCTAPLIGAMRSSDEQRDRRSRHSSARRGAIVPLSLIWALSSLSSLLSLSLSLSLSPEVNWSENEGRNSFPGQRWNLWSTRNHFLENNVFRDSQTHGFSGNWFLKLVFTRFKRSQIFTNKVNR